MSWKSDLFDARTNAIGKVNDALSSMGKKLWRCSETDSYRLMKLLVWSERYSVSIEYILGVILPVLSKAVERRTMKKSKGLGTTIPVLTGEVAHDILLERIAKDFPGNEHVHATREAERVRMVTVLDGDQNGVPRNPLVYSTSDEFTKAYVRTIARKRHERESVEDKIAAMPFRNNPFR